MESLIEKLKDFFGENKKRTVIIISAAAAVIILLIIFLGVFPRPVTDFSYPAAPGYENYVLSEKRGRIAVSMRISNIFRKDPDTDELVSEDALIYGDTDDDRRYILADFIIVNKSRRTIEFGHETFLMLHTEEKVTKNKYDSGTGGFFCIPSDEYDRAVGEKLKGYPDPILPGETKEFSMLLNANAAQIDDLNTMIFCDEIDYEAKKPMKYEVWGVGVPYMEFRFNNEDMFPELKWFGDVK